MSTRSENYELMVMSIGWVAGSSVVECLIRVCESSSFKFSKKNQAQSTLDFGISKKDHGPFWGSVYPGYEAASIHTRPILNPQSASS